MFYCVSHHQIAGCPFKVSYLITCWKVSNIQEQNKEFIKYTYYEKKIQP